MELNKDVLNLTKAIKLSETGEGDTYSAKGASGEVGAYQFMPSTWANYAGKYLGDSNALLSVENQNKVAYSFVNEKKNQGYSPAQIASMWNAGEGKPNAYKENWVGVNAQGVSFDTPTYVKTVSEHYQNLSSGGSVITTLPTYETTQVNEDKINPIIEVINDVAEPFLRTITQVKGIIGGIYGLTESLVGLATKNEETFRQGLSISDEYLSGTQDQTYGDAVNNSWNFLTGLFGQEPIDTHLFEDISPYGYTAEGEKMSDIDALKDSVGVGLEIAAWLVPQTKVASLTKGVPFLKDSAVKTITSSAKTATDVAKAKAPSYFSQGFLFGAGDTLSDGGSIPDAIKTGTLTGVFSAGLGVAGDTLFSVVKPAIQESVKYASVKLDPASGLLSKITATNMDDEVFTSAFIKHATDRSKTLPETITQALISSAKDTFNGIFGNIKNKELNIDKGILYGSFLNLKLGAAAAAIRVAKTTLNHFAETTAGKKYISAVLDTGVKVLEKIPETDRVQYVQPIMSFLIEQMVSDTVTEVEEMYPELKTTPTDVIDDTMVLPETAEITPVDLSGGENEDSFATDNTITTPKAPGKIVLPINQTKLVPKRNVKLIAPDPLVVPDNPETFRIDGE